VLLISCERDQTYGEKDIYFCTLLSDSTWSEPKNIGNVANSFADEVGPFLAADGITMYFSSAGHPGYGGGFEGDQSEFFESLFGRGKHRQGGRGGQSRQGMNFKGQDHHAKILIDLADAYNGAKRTISLHMPTQDATGHVSTQERKLDVSIPKGIKAGQNLRLSGQGGPGIGEGPAGDLYLEIDFHPNPIYRIDGKDIFIDIPLAPWEAALGTTVNVPTPAGSTLELKIPAATIAGRKMRLKGKGIPSAEAGDLYVVPTIVLPPANTDTQKEAYQNFEKAFDFNPRSHLKG
jgi:curved DNA-binding protein